MMAQFLQYLSDGAGRLVAFVLSLFPQAPDFAVNVEPFLTDGVMDAFGVFNWFVPVSHLVQMLAAWCTACLLYMAVSAAVGYFGRR